LESFGKADGAHTISSVAGDGGQIARDRKPVSTTPRALLPCRPGHAPAAKENFMAHPHPTARIAPLVRLAVLAAALVHAGPAGAADPTLLRINSFPNAKALPLQAGIGKGFFAKRGLKAELELTESSKAQRDGLAAGKFQIAQSAIDNAVAMIEGAKQDVVILSGGDSGMNEFFVQHGVNLFPELRGGGLFFVWAAHPP